MSGNAFDVAIIGGGPAGCRTAELIAGAGFSVAIIEEHMKVGEPVQCAGLISPRCFDILGFGGETVLNRVSGADIFSPSGRRMGIGNSGIKAFVVDRAAFDTAILEKAVDSGASLLSGTRIRDFGRSPGGQIILNRGQISAKLVVGADGARSAIRKWLGLGEPDFLLNGFCADITGPEMDPDRVKIFFGKETAPNFFAWMIPAEGKIRLGLCVRGVQGTVYDFFKRLFKSGETAKWVEGSKVLRSYSGTIPLGMLPATYAGGGMLVGDAACQVKATSGGGIYPGLVCARHCADSAIRTLESHDFSAKALSAYDAAWRRDIGEELEKALIIHRLHSSLDDAQFEDVFTMLLNPEIQDIINREGDIDYPSRLGWTLIRKEPGLLRYAGKFLKHGLMNF